MAGYESSSVASNDIHPPNPVQRAHAAIDRPVRGLTLSGISITTTQQPRLLPQQTPIVIPAPSPIVSTPMTTSNTPDRTPDAVRQSSLPHTCDDGEDYNLSNSCHQREHSQLPVNHRSTTSNVDPVSLALITVADLPLAKA
ncbi:hypothetical protein SprV_0200726200 [Sparganum proliferum]